MDKVLVIDDNDLDRKIAFDVLTHGGFAVEQAADGQTGLRLLYESRPDLVLLDVMMPSLDGWSVCSRVREMTDVPIIMVTSLNREEEMIRGLELGADDFVSKPVSPASLVARVRAVLRRTRAGKQVDSGQLYDDGKLLVDVVRHEVRLGEDVLDLTPTEFRLLAALAASPNRLHTYSSLLTDVWGPEYTDDIDFLRVYVWRLRKKLESGVRSPRWIETERGFGYRFNSPGRVEQETK
jgi:DNA-binding response OmpR family regulator